MLPKIMQKLFENGGSGPSLRADILPVDGTTLTINAQNKLEAKTSVTLSDAVDSDSSTTAASSRAVKTAYEKALSVQKFLEQAVDMGEIAGDAVLDGTRGRVFSATPTAATTFSASGVEPGACLLLELHNAGAQVVTWAMQPRWAGGVAPLLAAEGRDLVALTHGVDGWYGVHVAADAR